MQMSLKKIDPEVQDLTANGLEDIFKISEMCRHPSGFKN